MRSRTSPSLYVSRFSEVSRFHELPQPVAAGVRLVDPPGPPSPGAKPFGILIVTMLALVAAVAVSVVAIVSERSDNSEDRAETSLAGPQPEEIVRIFLRAMEARDLTTVKKVSCEADTEGRTSADMHFGGETSMTVAGKHFEVRGRTVVPLTADGKAPADLGGAEQRDDGGVAPLIRDGNSWKVCFAGFYTDISGSESHGARRTSPGGVSWV